MSRALELQTSVGKTASPGDATDRRQQTVTEGESRVPELGQMDAAHAKSPELSDTDSLTPRVPRVSQASWPPTPKDLRR